MKQSFVILFFLSFLSSLSAQPLNVSVSAFFEYYMDSIEIPIPLVKPLFPYHIRDVAVCKGGDRQGHRRWPGRQPRHAVNGVVVSEPSANGRQH